MATTATLLTGMFAATGGIADTGSKPHGAIKRLELEVSLAFTSRDKSLDFAQSDAQNPQNDPTDTGVTLLTPIIHTPKLLVNAGVGMLVDNGDSFATITAERELFDIPNLTLTGEVTDELPLGSEGLTKGSLGLTWHTNTEWRARGQSSFTTFAGVETVISGADNKDGQDVQFRGKMAYRF